MENLIAFEKFMQKIHLTPKKLAELNNLIFYNWNEICKIYIVRRPAGNGSDWHLIIALDTELLDRYDISNITGLNSTETKLAAYIKHFNKFA